MAKKSEGLSAAEMMMALKKLAQFHAASAVYYENNGAYDVKFARGIYNIGMNEIFGGSFGANIGFLLDQVLSTWPDLDKKLIDKMVKLAVHVIDLPKLKTELSFIEKMAKFYRVERAYSNDGTKAGSVQLPDTWRCLAGEYALQVRREGTA